MSKIVCVHSLSRGVGKSSITANVAVLIARQGYRVGVIDLSHQIPGIHTFFGLNEETIDRTLNDFLWEQYTLSDVVRDVTVSSGTLQEGSIAIMGGGVYLVPSRVKTGNVSEALRQGYDPDLLITGFRELVLRLKLDYLFLDTEAGIDEEVLLSLAISDILLMVLAPNAKAFQDGAVSLDIARRLGVPEITPVVNQVLESYDFKDLYRKVSRAYQVDTVEILPFSQDMLAIASQDLFCLRYPNHALADGFHAIAHHLISLQASQSPVRSLESMQFFQAQNGESTSAGISMLDVLRLPDPHRKVVNWILRQGIVSESRLFEELHLEEDVDLSTCLQSLIEQGFIQIIDLNGIPHYQVFLVMRQGRSNLSSIWDSLGDFSSENHHQN
jgi:MinD-like ATPase involved in chromosome partitioning or flagellar assembly